MRLGEALIITKAELNQQCQSLFRRKAAPIPGIGMWRN